MGESKKSCYGNFADFPCCLVYPAVYAFNAMLCHALLSISRVSDYFCSLDSILCLKIRWVDGEDRHPCIVGLEKLSHSGKRYLSRGQRLENASRLPRPPSDNGMSQTTRSVTSPEIKTLNSNGLRIDSKDIKKLEACLSLSDWSHFLTQRHASYRFVSGIFPHPLVLSARHTGKIAIRDGSVCMCFRRVYA